MNLTEMLHRLRPLQQHGRMPDNPPPPVGTPGMMAPPPQPMDTLNDPTLAAGMAAGAMGGPPPMGPGRQPDAMDGSVMSGKDHLERPDEGGLDGGDLLGIGKADAAEIGQGVATGRDLLNTPRVTGATPVPMAKPGREPVPMSKVRPRVPVPSSRPDVMPHSAPGYGYASGYDPGAAYSPAVAPQSRVAGNGGPPQALFPWAGQTQAPVGGGMAYGGTTAGGMAPGEPPKYLMDYIAKMMGRG